MLIDVENNEVIEEYELRDVRQSSYSKLLDKETRYNCKRTEDTNVYLDPYSELFNFYFSSFNNKKFSLV